MTDPKLSLQNVQCEAVGMILNDMENPSAEKETAVLAHWVATSVRGEPEVIVGHLNAINNKFVTPGENDDEEIKTRRLILGTMFGESVIQKLCVQKSPFMSKIDYVPNSGFGVKKLVRN